MQPIVTLFSVNGALGGDVQRLRGGEACLAG